MQRFRVQVETKQIEPGAQEPENGLRCWTWLGCALDIPLCGSQDGN